MRASSFKSYFALAHLICSIVSASPFVARQVTEFPLDTWVSVDASGSIVATITPVLTTINGVATTISANLGAATSSATGDSIPTVTASGSAPTATGGGSFPVCHNPDGKFVPFCLPSNGSSVYVGETYYVTWDINYFAEKNSTLQIQANYVDASGGGPQAFESPITQNFLGFISWTIDKSWLQDLSANNVTLFIVPFNPLANEPQSLRGPTVMVTNRPPTYDVQPTTPVPKGESLYIALPSVFGFIVLCVCVNFFINRKHRKIGLGNVMGRRKGYGVGKSRYQRLGLRKKRSAAMQLREQELTSEGQYRDTPQDHESRGGTTGQERADSDALGSLAGTPTGERPNYFRDEMKRQEQSR